MPLTDLRRQDVRTTRESTSNLFRQIVCFIRSLLLSLIVIFDIETWENRVQVTLSFSFISFSCFQNFFILKCFSVFFSSVSNLDVTDDIWDTFSSGKTCNIKNYLQDKFIWMAHFVQSHFESFLKTLLKLVWKRTTQKKVFFRLETLILV